MPLDPSIDRSVMEEAKAALGGIRREARKRRRRRRGGVACVGVALVALGVALPVALRPALPPGRPLMVTGTGPAPRGIPSTTEGSKPTHPRGTTTAVTVPPATNPAPGHPPTSQTKSKTTTGETVCSSDTTSPNAPKIGTVCYTDSPHPCNQSGSSGFSGDGFLRAGVLER